MLPEKVSITKATFPGNDNYHTEAAWLGEVNGVTYESTEFPFPKSREQVSYAITFNPAATGTITFTPMGKQMVLVIGLEGYRGTLVLVGDVNLDGQVGIGDIVAITNIMAGDILDEEALNRADVNHDGDIGIGDIVAITNIMAGIEAE